MILMISRTWQAIVRASRSLRSFSRISSVGLFTGGSLLGVPRVLEAVVAGLLDADAFELRLGEGFQALENLNAQILCGGHFLAKSRDIFIERHVIEFLEHLAFDEGVQIGKIRDHARGRVNIS